MKELEIYPESEDMIIDDKNLAKNPANRVPVCLALDVSSSMIGEPIDELNKGVRMFFDAVLDDKTARDSADIAIVTFGNSAQLVLDFDDVTKQNPPVLTASGSTPMGAAVNMALDNLIRRKSQYKESGVQYYQPWLVLMTDGAPTDDIESAVSRTCDLIMEKTLTIFPVGIGPHANLGTLERFSPKREPLRLKGLNFAEFFEWLSSSISETGKSGDRDSHEALGWAEKE